MANFTSFLFRLLFAIYVMNTSVLAFNLGSSWRQLGALAVLKDDGTVERPPILLIGKYK